MADRDKIIAFMNDFLDISSFHDSSDNGLQVEGAPEVFTVAAGVSPSLELFNQAAKRKAELIILHHGLFWGKSIMLNGYFKKRIETLLKNNINLAAYHLPLDAHPEIGNNASIAKLFKPEKNEDFGDYHGKSIGRLITLKNHMTGEDTELLLKKELSANLQTVGLMGKKIKTIGIVSGGAAGMIEDAVKYKADAFITGDSGEYAFETSRETGCAFIACGHYTSEKLGVQNLAAELEKKFKVETFFVDTKNPF